MAQRAESPQNCRDQPAHQRAIAIRKRLQSRMSANAVELIVEHAVLVQHAIKNIGRDPARCEAGYLGGRDKSRRLHAAKTISGGTNAIDIAQERDTWHRNMPNVRIAACSSYLVFKM